MTSELRWKQRFENFQKAFAVFERTLTVYRQHASDEIYQLSLVQAYEFTFELAWKTMKDYLESQGDEGITTPKRIIRQAFNYKIINDGRLWLDGLDIRNETAHVYSEVVMKRVLTFADNHFHDMLIDFNDRFKNI